MDYSTSERREYIKEMRNSLLSLGFKVNPTNENHFFDLHSEVKIIVTPLKQMWLKKSENSSNIVCKTIEEIISNL